VVVAQLVKPVLLKPFTPRNAFLHKELSIEKEIIPLLASNAG